MEIVCDGGPSQGCGHLRRSLALADVLQSRKHKVRLRSLSPAGATILAEEEAPNAEGSPDLLLFDLPDTQEAPIAQACEGGTLTIALDYFGQASPTLTISVRERMTEIVGTRRSGIEYAIVREEILAEKSETVGEGVLLMLGGSDVRGLTTQLARTLIEMGADLTVILGPYAPNPGTLTGAQVFRNPPNLPSLMARTRWAVSSGGVSMSELMFLGKPVHVASQTDAEEKLASLVMAKGGLLGVGIDSVRMYSDNELKKVSVRASEIVDGMGAQRIVDSVEEILAGATH